MLKIIMAKNKTLWNQQKQIAQPVNREEIHYVLLVTVSCILRQALLTMMIIFLSASNELILFNLLTLLSIITDFQFQLMIN